MKTIKLAYSDLYNAGDLMNVDIVEMLSGCKVKRSKTFCADMTAIGGAVYGLQYSDNWKKYFQHVFQLIYGKKPVYIWGSGFWHDYNSNGLYRENLKVCALRGRKTQQRLYDLTGNFYDVPLADGGLLIDRLVKPAKKKKYKIGLIPHMSQQEESNFVQLSEKEGVHLINIKDKPQKVGYDISECETVISSSLHGLIFADAFHIPNIHVLGKNQLREGNFKFEDYYSAFGLEDHPFMLGDRVPSYDEIISSYRIDPDVVERKKRELIECFPHF